MPCEYPSELPIAASNWNDHDSAGMSRKAFTLICEIGNKFSFPGPELARNSPALHRMAVSTFGFLLSVFFNLSCLFCRNYSQFF